MLVQSKRNKHAALKLMRKLLRKYAVAPERMVTVTAQQPSTSASTICMKAALQLRVEGLDGDGSSPVRPSASASP